MNSNLLVANYKLNNNTQKTFSHSKFKKVFSIKSLFYMNKISAMLGFNFYFINTLGVNNLLRKHQIFLNEFLHLIKKEQIVQENYLKNYWSILVEKEMYKGIRYFKNLPVRGQRTHTNRKTARKLNGKNT